MGCRQWSRSPDGEREDQAEEDRHQDCWRNEDRKEEATYCYRRATKLAQLEALLRRHEGATLDQISSWIGWQAHSVRGAVSGALEKKAGACDHQRQGEGETARLSDRRLSGRLVRSQESALEAEIQRLDDLGLDDLRKLCGPLLGAVPVHHGAHLLRRRLAYELQAKALGDLPAETQRRLQRLHQSFKADPQHKPLPRRPLKPDLVLTRSLQGMMHQVQVTDQGFDYRGERFTSLSEVARRITGTRWSGPPSCGLKKAGS